jgi:hypothetical protein
VGPDSWRRRPDAEQPPGNDVPDATVARQLSARPRRTRTPPSLSIRWRRTSRHSRSPRSRTSTRGPSQCPPWRPSRSTARGNPWTVRGCTFDWRWSSWPVILWAPTTPSSLLTWYFSSGKLADLLRGTSGSGTVSAHATTIHLPSCAQGIRLACLARPVRPGQGRRDSHPASPGRRAPAPGQDPETVLGRQGGPGRAGPAAAQWCSPPAAPDRLPSDLAALACRPGQAAAGLPPHSGTAAHRAGRPRAGADYRCSHPGDRRVL